MGVPTTADGRTIQPVMISDSGGSPATVRQTAGPPSSGQTQKNYAGSASINTGATVTLETVTPGKTYYITDILMTTDSATPFDVQIKAGATVIFEALLSSTSPVGFAGIETQPNAASGVIVTLVAATVTGKNIAYNVFGYEQ